MQHLKIEHLYIKKKEKNMSLELTDNVNKFAEVTKEFNDVLKEKLENKKSCEEQQMLEK